MPFRNVFIEMRKKKVNNGKSKLGERNVDSVFSFIFYLKYCNKTWKLELVFFLEIMNLL